MLIQSGGNAVSLIRSRESLEEVLQHYINGDKGNMKLRSYHIYPYQDSIIDIMHRSTGKSKAEIIREIIDDWCKSKLVETSGSELAD